MTVSLPENKAESPSTERTDNIAGYLSRELAPLAQAVDDEGLYPREILSGLGRLGGFGASASADAEVSPEVQLQTIMLAGRHCGSTAFLAWCQSASAWYLARAPQQAPRQRYLADVLAGSLLAGSGMSNFLKHFAGIEKIRLNARAVDGGYQIDGILPWVSNLDHGHLLLTAAAVDDGRYIMFAIPTDSDGLRLHPCPDFSGMEGTNTWNVRMKDVWVPTEDILAEPEQFGEFIDVVKQGLILTQTGMGLGIIAGSLGTLNSDRTTTRLVNHFLETDTDDIQQALNRLQAEAFALAPSVSEGTAPPLAVLRLRAQVSEWTLRATQSTALHVGARGYLMRHPAQRRLREAMFVAIVTPALKHLRKEIDALEKNDTEAA